MTIEVSDDVLIVPGAGSRYLDELVAGDLGGESVRSIISISLRLGFLFGKLSLRKRLFEDKLICLSPRGDNGGSANLLAKGGEDVISIMSTASIKSGCFSGVIDADELSPGVGELD